MTKNQKKMQNTNYIYIYTCSQLPIFQNIWGMSCATFDDWPVAKESSYTTQFHIILTPFPEITYFHPSPVIIYLHFLFHKPKQSCFKFNSSSGSLLVDTEDWWAKNFGYAETQSQIQQTSTVITHQLSWHLHEEEQQAALLVGSGRTTAWLVNICALQLCF
jgi:hypothetical protein